MFERKSEVSVPTPWTYPPPGRDQGPGHTHLLEKQAWYPAPPPPKGPGTRDTPIERIWEKRYPPLSTPPPPNRMTDPCENITFPQLNKLPYVGHDRLHWILHHDLIVTEQSLKPQVSNNPCRELLFLPNLRSEELWWKPNGRSPTAFCASASVILLFINWCNLHWVPLTTWIK